MKNVDSGVRRKVQWHFLPGKTGFGPTSELWAELKTVGIGIVEHSDFK